MLSENIDDLIDKFINEANEKYPGLKNVMGGKIEQLKNDIWHTICEHTECEEKEMQGGSLEPGKMGRLWWRDEDENEKGEPLTDTQKRYAKKRSDWEIEQDVFHNVVAKSLKKLKEILEVATKETSYQFGDVSELLGQYVTEKLSDAGYNSIIRDIISRLKSFQSQYSGEQAMFGFEAEILIRAIENLRRLTNELIASGGKELPLKRLVWNKMITSEEKEKFDHELSPETIKEVLTKRPVVN